MKTDTLAFRLFFFTSLWMLVSLAIVAVLVSQDYRRTVEKQFENLVTANLYNLMGSVGRGSDGKLTGAPQLGDSRYQQFQSGWYWAVVPVSGDQSALASSSLRGVEFPASSDIKYDSNFQRAFQFTDAIGHALMVVEAKVFLGEGNDLYLFRATGNLAVLNEEISNFRQRLILLLGFSGIGLIATSYFIVRFGLKPLRLATSQLAEIRNGNADKIEGRFPREIAPLIEETNALIKSNQSIVERSRTQVGNLAHSLKTPLSVMSLELKNLPAPLAKITKTQLSAMNSQIQTYLNRAMVSARHGALTSRTAIHDPLTRLVRTFNKLFPDINYTYSSASPSPLIFAGEQQDFEEIIGNILENAGSYAAGTVDIKVQQTQVGSAQCIEIKISDDGKGLAPDEIEYVLKRGNRLDENRPGTGLGLSIVSDILSEYNGKLNIQSADSGGLRVVVHLPVA